MKNFSRFKTTLRVVGIIAFVAVIGFSIAACGGGDDDGGGDPNKVAKPTATPGAGAVASGTNVTLATTTAGAAIWYTTNGNAPAKNGTGSTQYASPIAVTAAVTIKAIAVKDGMTDSDVLTAAYTISGSGPSATIEMVQVPGGSFQMGKDLGSAGSNDISYVHTVTLTSFYMGKYEVTQAQYRAVMGSNPGTIYGVGDNYPVYDVSWYNALVFCNKLSEKDGLTPAYKIKGSTNTAQWGAVPTDDKDSAWDAAEIASGSTGYRLPTEAQWEYAAKGGDPTAAGWVGYTYSGSDTIDNVAWYNANSDSKPHEVGKKAPNKLGLYDMSGNVSERCWDWYALMYPNEEQTNPIGPTSGSNRIIRGSYCFGSESLLHSVSRSSDSPYRKGTLVGIRVVRP